MGKDTKMQKVIDTMTEIRLEDLDRDEPYEDGSYTWRSFLSNIGWEEAKSIVKEARERVIDADYDEDEYGADLEWMSDEIIGEIKKRGYSVFDLPISYEFPIKE